MQQYHELIERILETGVVRGDRTGVGTKSIFGYQMRFPLTDGFPLLTTKKIHFKSVAVELLWFLRGDTNTKFLHDHGVTIWDEWADAKGDLGPVYGHQWRSWETPAGASVDQIVNVVDAIKNNPNSRRHVVVAYNPSDVERMALPPCHAMFQFYVAEGRLSCHLYQRSADTFLGVPFNIASYALLTAMIAKVCDLAAGDFIHSIGDAHLYLNHITQAEELLSREPFKLPRLKLSTETKDLFQFSLNDIAIEGYQSHAHIKADIAV